jgi:hypothetical protein
VNPAAVAATVIVTVSPVSIKLTKAPEGPRVYTLKLALVFIEGGFLTLLKFIENTKVVISTVKHPVILTIFGLTNPNEHVLVLNDAATNCADCGITVDGNYTVM